MIKLNKLSKSFDGGQTYSVKDVTLHIERGETLVLLGSSGSGKSTTLKMINQLIVPSSGQVIVDGHDVKHTDPVQLRRSIGYVFQSIGLFPHMTAAENIAIVLRLEGESFEQRMKRAHELLTFVNLEPEQYAHRYPDELSGGQQQRVGVARALANQPDILLMDEPFGALDSITRDALQEDMMRLKTELKKTVVFVTHDVMEALRLADKIAVMDKGQLLQVGTKEAIINQPINEFVHHLFRKPVEQLAHYSEHLR